jgi:hypothetical protein
MSDKVYVEQSAVLEALQAAINKQAEKPDALQFVSDILNAPFVPPPVPQEMSAREYEKAIDRAFYSADDAWGEWADAIDEGNKDKAVAIIEKWAREHPEK